MANPIIARLTNKVGPLPAWAWAAIPATAYVAWSYYRASQGEGYIADPEPSTDEALSPVDEYGLNTGGASLPGYGSMPGGSSNLPPVDMPKPNNQTWFRQASTYLISEGFKPSDIITALNAYLYGSPDKINSNQMNALQRALIYLGAAPEPAFIPEQTTNTPTPKPPPVKPPATPPKSKPVPPPGQVKGLKLTKSGVSGIYRVSWGAPSGGTRPSGYVVQYQVNAKAWTNAPTGGSWFADIGGIPGGSLLTVRVAAKAGTLQGAWSTSTVRT